MSDYRSELYDKLGDKLTWLMGYGDDVYLAVGSDIKDVIYNMPTAYSVDKVVKELESRICTIDEDDVEIAMRNKHFRTAIEIVKQGGISDDVCEWNCDEYGRWHTECHILADNDPLEYTYCPYCGKKILCKE